MLPYLTGASTAPSRGTTFWQMDLYRNLQRHSKKPEPFVTEVARRDKWKMTARDGVAQELFDIEADPLETRNLIGDEAQLAGQLTQELRVFLNAPRVRSGKDVNEGTRKLQGGGCRWRKISE
ncbi:MAG: hypothetical protein U5J83_01195 [Bryobacterales bacterium]|nr:hypothetical protein [Bryobacterales bacterium]